MEKNRYRNLNEQIHVPAGLNERVLRAAENQKPAAENPGPSQKRRALLRAAVCAACAVALVAGTLTLRPAGDSGTSEAVLPGFTFGLTAYAADTGEYYGTGVNGGLAMTNGSGLGGLDIGIFTGCLFRVTGEEIETISLSISGGGLYRSQTSAVSAREAGELESQEPQPGETVYSIYRMGDGPWYAEEMTPLGSSVTEAYDPDTSYGFWVQPGETSPAMLEDSTISGIDTFEGKTLTVTVTFSDGSQETKDYQLSAERLKVTYLEDGTRVVLPQLAGEEDLSTYGIYAVDLDLSRWLTWPVEGADTVSMSNPFGIPRWQPGGRTYVAHEGIDIPAAEGTPILAAEDGTVTEIGFDREQGNYLVLDHGGGLTTLYGQCRNITGGLKQGDTVRAGEMIAAVGSTGMSAGPHLHFEVRQDGTAQNPVAYFDSEIRDTLHRE